MSSGAMHPIHNLTIISEGGMVEAMRKVKESGEYQCLLSTLCNRIDDHYHHCFKIMVMVRSIGFQGDSQRVPSMAKALLIFINFFNGNVASTITGPEG